MVDQLIYVDTLRGDDSTGIMAINKFNSVEVAKAAIPGWEFITTPEYKKIMDAAQKNGKIVVGHNRSATKGSVSDDNAHPFTVDHITLVHNGTLYNHSTFSDQTVDSHAITELIAKQGYKKALSMLSGAFALIWWDSQRNKLCVTRNSQRPLGYVYTKDKRNLLLASEVFMIPMLAHRNNLQLDDKYNLFKSETTDKVGTLYELDLEELTFKEEAVDFYNPKSVETTAWAWSDEESYYGCGGYPERQQGRSNTEGVVHITKQDWKNKRKEQKAQTLVPTGLVDPTAITAERGKGVNSPLFWTGKGKKITIDVDDHYTKGTLEYVRGKWGPILVSGAISDLDLDAVYEFGTVIGTVVAWGMHNDLLTDLSITQIKPYLNTKSSNGTLIDANLWTEIGEQCICDECQSEIKIADIPESVIRLHLSANPTNYFVKRCVCPLCCEELKITKQNQKKEISDAA